MCESELELVKSTEDKEIVNENKIKEDELQVEEISEIELAEKEITVGENADKSTDERIDDILKHIRDMEELFEKKILIDTYKDRILENQGNELQKYREGFYKKIFKPMLIDCIMIVNDLHRMVQDYKKKANEVISNEKMISIFEIFESDMEDVLDKYGVEIYSCDGEIFNGSEQKIVRIIETNDENMHRHIAERLTKGFKMEGVILSPEKVNVYKYDSKEK